MRRSHPAANKAVSHEVNTDIDLHTRLQDSWLIVARVGWGAFVILALGLFLVSMPGYYNRLQTLSSPVLSDPTAVRVGLAHLGLSSNFFADYSLTLALILILVSSIVAGVIVWRKSDDWMALLTAFVMVMYGRCSLSPISPSVIAILLW